MGPFFTSLEVIGENQNVLINCRKDYAMFL